MRTAFLWGGISVAVLVAFVGYCCLRMASLCDESEPEDAPETERHRLEWAASHPKRGR